MQFNFLADDYFNFQLPDKGFSCATRKFSFQELLLCLVLGVRTNMKQEKEEERKKDIGEKLLLTALSF